MNNFFGRQILETAQESMLDIWNFIYKIIESFYVSTGWITEHSFIKAACSVTTGIAATFLVLLASKHLFTTYILEIEGDSEMNPLQFLVKASIALALIQMQNYLFYYFLKLSGVLYNEIIGIITITPIDLSKVTNGTEYLVANKELGNVSAVYLNGTVIIIYIGLTIKACLRAIELAIMKIMFPLFCCDMITPNRERWSSFSMAYLVTIFGYIIQVFCFKISIVMFIDGRSVSAMFEALALGYFALKAPKWLEKFAYSSGIGQSVAGAGRTIAMTAVQAVRFIH